VHENHVNFVSNGDRQIGAAFTQTRQPRSPETRKRAPEDGSRGADFLNRVNAIYPVRSSRRK
jgi:hypothetical protein